MRPRRPAPLLTPPACCPRLPVAQKVRLYLTGQQPGMEYVITVRTFNGMGPGPTSPDFTYLVPTR